MRDVQTELGDLILERLKRLPTHHRIPSKTGASWCSFTARRSIPQKQCRTTWDDDELDALIGDDPADIIVCGMSHVPFDRMIGDVRIINVGSVGEAPGGFANATWIEVTASGVHVEAIVVPLQDEAIERRVTVG